MTRSAVRPVMTTNANVNRSDESVGTARMRPPDNATVRAALKYARRDWLVFPLWGRKGEKCTCGNPDCKDQGKHPNPALVRHGFKNATTDADIIKRWWRKHPEAGIGVATGRGSGIIVIDVDLKNGKDGRKALRELSRELGFLPETKTAETPSVGKHLYFRYVEGIGSSNGVIGPGIDIKSDGGYVVAPPSHGLYEWIDPRKAVELPASWVEHLRKPPRDKKRKKTRDPKPSLKKIEAALAVIKNDSDANVTRNEWINIGQAIWEGTGGSEEGFELFDAWSKQWPGHNDDNTRKAWDSFDPREITVGTLFHKADAADPSWRDGFGSSQDERINAQLAELARYSGIDYELKLKAAAKRIGVPKAVLHQEVEKLRATQVSAAPPPATLDELAALSSEIIASKDVLGLFAKEFAKVVAGETANAKILYLNGTTRLFEKANHTAVKGTSATGKSWLRTSVVAFMPPEQVYSFTSMSEKALLYAPEGFEHKILSMGEAVSGKEVEFQDYLLRELMSENKLRHSSVQKIHGELKTVMIEKNGPVAFMVTTTRNKLNPENETRMLSLEINDSQDQTQWVLDKIAEREGRNRADLKIELEPWHNYQRWLAAGDLAVDIPFARSLASLIPPKAVRQRRDFSQLLRAVKAHALLHRKHRKRNDAGVIVATIDDDYEPVRALLADVLATSAEVKLAKTISDTVKAVATLQRSERADQGVTARALGEYLKLDRTAGWRRLHAAELAGYVINLEDRRGRPARYQAKDLADDHPDTELLPTCEQLRAAISKRKRERSGAGAGAGK